MQDADRPDAIGAIGIVRTYSVGGSENRSLYNPTVPFCESEIQLDGTQWTLDHIKKKLAVAVVEEVLELAKAVHQFLLLILMLYLLLGWHGLS